LIAVQLTGGLGNQMFQYATARALAARRRTRLVLDSSWFQGRGGGVTTEPRRYELDCFALDAEVVPIGEVARLHRTLVPSRKPVLRQLVEPEFGHPADLLNAPDNTYLRGYWQNPTYFADFESSIRRDFTFRADVVAAVADRATQLAAARLPVVSVHVRRGDYVTDRGVGKRMGTLERGYYLRALEKLAAGVGAFQVLLFTDDPDWCSANLKLPYEHAVVSATRAEREAWAAFLHLMTLCDHHVLANSSFSWWGAWLNPSPRKVVVAPRPWLVDARWDDAHRLPREWVRVPREDHQADQPPSTTTFAPVT